MFPEEELSYRLIPDLKQSKLWLGSDTRGISIMGLKLADQTRNMQECRRSALPSFKAKAIAEWDTAAWMVELRSRRRDLADVPADAEKAPGFNEFLLAERRYIEDRIMDAEEILRSRGVQIPKETGTVSPIEQEVRRVVELITTKQQIKLALMKARDEMKAGSPLELHPEIERSFRKAIEALPD